jgi:hypothetical protein
LKIDENKRQHWEKSLAEIRDDVNYQLKTYVNVCDLKTDDLTKQFSGNLMNFKKPLRQNFLSKAIY